MMYLNRSWRMSWEYHLAAILLKYLEWLMYKIRPTRWSCRYFERQCFKTIWNHSNLVSQNLSVNRVALAPIVCPIFSKARGVSKSRSFTPFLSSFLHSVSRSSWFWIQSDSFNSALALLWFRESGRTAVRWRRRRRTTRRCGTASSRKGPTWRWTLLQPCLLGPSSRMRGPYLYLRSSDQWGHWFWCVCFFRVPKIPWVPTIGSGAGPFDPMAREVIGSGPVLFDPMATEAIGSGACGYSTCLRFCFEVSCVLESPTSAVGREAIRIIADRLAYGDGTGDVEEEDLEARVCSHAYILEKHMW